MHPFQPPRRPRGPASSRRMPCALLLSSALAGMVWLAAPQAHAQSSTLVYGSDTDYVAYDTPGLRTFGQTLYITGGSLELGATGQFTTSYGAAYDPDAVDITQGFVSRVDDSNNGGNGIVFVVKNPTSSDYLETPGNPPAGGIYGLGAFSYDNTTQAALGLKSALGVACIAYKQSTANANDRHYKEVEVFADDANGTTTVLADVKGLDLNGAATAPGSNTIQVQYLPKFNTLDVYIGARLITRVAGVDLAALGISSGGEVEMGVTSGVPGISGNTDYFPAFFNRFSISNQLTFGAGFGPNYYEDRFPFLTTGQSVWGTGSDTIEYKKFLGASSNGQTKTSNQIGGSLSVAGQSIFSLEASAFASYNVGIGVDATATGGTADISYPLFLDMEFPTQYSVAPNTPFALPITFYPDLAATINTTTPSANVKADLQCQTTFGVNLDTSVFGQSITSGNLFTASINIPDTTFFDAQKILTSGLIPNVNGGQTYLQGDEGETGKRNSSEDGTPGKGSSEGAEGGESLTKYINVGITIPDLSTSGTVTATGTNGSHLTSTASSPFVTLSSDFTNAVLSEIPGLDILTEIPFFNNDYSLNLGGQSVELGSHFCDIYGDVNVGAAVNYDFTPQPQVYLILNPVDPNNPNGLGPFALDPATNKVLNPPTLTMPADGEPLTVTPRVVLNTSKLQTKGSITIGGDLSINPLSLSFAYNSTSFSTDPEFGFPLTVGGSIPVYTYTTSFAVGNASGGAANAVPFQTYLQGKSFTLFPTTADNPAIDAVTPNMITVQKPGSSATLPIQITAEHASYSGSVVWDYDGVISDPQTTLPARVFNSLTSISAAIPYSLLTAQGLHTITLINGDSSNAAQQYASNLATFTINAPSPILYQARPAGGNGSIVAGGSAFNLIVSGDQFSPPIAPSNGSTGYPGSVVLWNGKPLVTTYTDTAHLSATVPSSLIAAAGTAAITVFTAGPGGGTSKPATVTINNPRPVLTSLSQTQIAPGLTSLILTLRGTSFVPGSTVFLSSSTGTTNRTVSYMSPTSLNLALSAADLSTPGTFSVQVQTPKPGGGFSSSLSYTIGQAPVTPGGVYFVPVITRTSSGYAVNLTANNTSLTNAVDSTIITSETIGGDSTGKNAIYPILPNPLKAIPLGTIAPNGKITPTTVDTFPFSIGASGKAVLLTIQGSSGGRSFTSRLRVTLP